jgi:hypothetical protein
MLPCPIALQCFETIPANLRQIVQASRRMETRKPRACSCFDAAEAPAAEFMMKRLGFTTPKRKDHLHNT